MSNICPCGSKLDYNQCCGGIIRGMREAKTCEELMRSRYTAYTQADINYLMLSQHSKSRPEAKERKEIKQWAQSVQWMQLIVMNTWNGNEKDQQGHVEFKAIYFENGQIQQIHEKSLFKREKGKWVYVSGVHF